MACFGCVGGQKTGYVLPLWSGVVLHLTVYLHGMPDMSQRLFYCVGMGESPTNIHRPLLFTKRIILVELNWGEGIRSK